ncbi:MAG: hydroxyacid dehydrogenase [Azospirillaceae bacterium]
MTARIVIAEFMDQEAVDRLAAVAEVTYDPKLVDDPGRLEGLVADCDALIVRNRTQVRDALLDGLKRARVVGRLGVGLDNIDVAGCEAKGIEVIPATGANAVAVAEYVLATALVLARHGAYAASDRVAAGDWPRGELIGGEIFGKTFGLIGFGGVAREVAARARPFGVDLIAYDPVYGPDHTIWLEYDTRPLPLESVIAKSDILSLHVPLTDQTRNLVDAGAISRMHRGAILINTARGGVVDEAALAVALRDGRIGGAALDVFADEPLQADGPLTGVTNLILSPHIAGVTEESNVRVSHLIADKVMAALGLAAGSGR